MTTNLGTKLPPRLSVSLVILVDICPAKRVQMSIKVPRTIVIILHLSRIDYFSLSTIYVQGRGKFVGISTYIIHPVLLCCVQFYFAMFSY
jgi:hypothetical protein